MPTQAKVHMEEPKTEDRKPQVKARPERLPVYAGDSTFGGVFQRPDESNAEFAYRQDFLSNW